METVYIGFVLGWYWCIIITMATRKKRVPISKIVDTVFEYLKEYNTANGYMPTQNEVAQHFKNPQTKASYTSAWASNCLHELEAQGRIELLDKKHRGIVLTKKKK